MRNPEGNRESVISGQDGYGRAVRKKVVLVKHTTNTTEIARALQWAGVEAIVTARGRVIHLEGLVESPEGRRAASQIIAAIDPLLVVENELEVIPILPVPDEFDEDLGRSPLDDAMHVVGEEVAKDERDSRSATPDVDEAWGEDPGAAVPYFPPTDPVIRVGPRDTEMVGGFAESSLDEPFEEMLDPTALDGHRRGDDEIVAEVRRDLAEDAATADLQIRIRVTHGIVHLRGIAPSVDDTEAAEEVVRRVPGVVDVDEGMTVTWD